MRKHNKRILLAEIKQFQRTLFVEKDKPSEIIRNYRDPKCMATEVGKFWGWYYQKNLAYGFIYYSRVILKRGVKI